jgi:hypothetical protein
VLYKALGFAVWKLAVAYVRRRYGRKLGVAAVLGVASIAIAGYLAGRSSSS